MRSLKAPGLSLQAASEALYADMAEHCRAVAGEALALPLATFVRWMELALPIGYVRSCRCVLVCPCIGASEWLRILEHAGIERGHRSIDVDLVLC